jgi:LysM repeat protein
MPKTRIIKYALIVFLLLPLITFAQTQEIKKYKIIKGDTLWDISKRDLNDPFMWPAIWKENKWIANPHWIYPGQMIKIPLYLLQKEKSGEEAVSKPAAESQEPTAAAQEPAGGEVKKEAVQIIKQPLVNRNLLMASGYIADKIPRVGQVDDLSSEQIVTGSEDIVYLTTDHPAKAGDKFYVINSSERIKHPITGRKIGYVITIKGIVEIVKIKSGETTAKITQSFSEIGKGDRLDSYYDIESPIDTGHFRSPDINGMIIATSNNMALQSMLDIIYIDKGCKDGIEAGDMFRTIAVDAHAVPNGVIQVISCRDHTATAIIKSSIIPISAGNIFTMIDEEINF